MLDLDQLLSLESFPSIAARWVGVVGPVILGGHSDRAVVPGGFVPIVTVGSPTLVTPPPGKLSPGGFDGWARQSASGAANLRRAKIPGSTLGQSGVTGGCLIVFSTTATSSTLTLSGLGSDNGGGGNTVVAISTGSTTNDVYVQFGGSVGFGSSNFAGKKVNDGKLHAVIILGTWNTSTGTAHAWLDGQYLGSFAANNVGVASTFQWICAGSWRRAASDLSTGATHTVALATPILRGLSIAEGCELTAHPWQILDYDDDLLALIKTGASGLQAAANAQASAGGSLTTAIPIVAAAVSAATVGGALTTAIPLAGLAASVALADGELTAQVQLSGAALAAVAASGALTTQIRLSGSAVAQALAAADLTTAPAGLAATASASAQSSGALTTAIPLAGAASAIAISAAGLTTAIPLAGAAAASCTATGSLVVEMGLSGAALAQAGAGGTLSTQIRLSGSAVMQALASASLSAGGAPILYADRRYRARRPRTPYRVAK